MSEQTPDPHAGLSATGRTADQFSPGDDEKPGTDYGSPDGVAEDELEIAGGDDSGRE